MLHATVSCRHRNEGTAPIDHSIKARPNSKIAVVVRRGAETNIVVAVIAGLLGERGVHIDCNSDQRRLRALPHVADFHSVLVLREHDNALRLFGANLKLQVPGRRCRRCVGVRRCCTNFD